MSAPAFRRYLSAAAYNLASAFVSRGMLFVNNLLLVRLLGPYSYGVWAALLSVFLVGTAIANLKLDLSLVRFLPATLVRGRDSCEELVGGLWRLVIALGSVVSIALLLLTDAIARHIYGKPELYGYLQIMALATAFAALAQMGVATLAGLKEFRILARLQACNSAIQLVATVGGCLSMGLHGAVFGYAMSAVASGLISAFLARNQLRRLGIGLWTRPIDSATRRRAVGFSAGSMLSGLLAVSGLWCGNLILTRFRGFNEASMFSVAYGFAVFALFVPGYLLNPSLPFLSETHASARFEDFGSFVRRTFRAGVSTVLPIAILLACVAKQVIVLIYGERFSSA